MEPGRTGTGLPACLSFRRKLIFCVWPPSSTATRSPALRLFCLRTLSQKIISRSCTSTISSIRFICVIVIASIFIQAWPFSYTTQVIYKHRSLTWETTVSPNPEAPPRRRIMRRKLYISPGKTVTAQVEIRCRNSTYASNTLRLLSLQSAAFQSAVTRPAACNPR